MVREVVQGGVVELGRFIEDQRRRAHLSVKRLADLAGISNPYLSQIERGVRKPSAEILQQLAKALSISAETLYEQAGIVDPTSPRPPSGVIGAIQADPDLTDEQKASLVQVYESFRATTAPTATDGDRPKPTVTRNRRVATEVD
jgi:transcriptional regulator with XRE-family HTH domain